MKNNFYVILGGHTLVSATLVFLVATFIIMIGAASNYLFRRTGIPDMLFLVLLGLIFGPLLGVLKAGEIESLAPFLSVLALVIILFDGGLRLDVQKAVAQAPRAVVLAVFGFAHDDHLWSRFGRGYSLGIACSIWLGECRPLHRVHRHHNFLGSYEIQAR
jgi:NhaP-type Na+/H+ and K+/H+ antiporter